MSKASQKRAVRSYRKRLSVRGMSRFEVVAKKEDRDLIRSVAQRLSESTNDRVSIRAALQDVLSGNSQPKGGILRALRASPLVGEDLGIERPIVSGRDIVL